jgi:hypothetical protein
MENSSADAGQDLGRQTNVAVWFLVASSAVFLGLRIYCKYIKNRGLWWDDYVLIASWVSGLPP